MGETEITNQQSIRMKLQRKSKEDTKLTGNGKGREKEKRNYKKDCGRCD
jgi:hypothetical protein